MVKEIFGGCGWDDDLTARGDILYTMLRMVSRIHEQGPYIIQYTSDIRKNAQTEIYQDEQTEWELILNLINQNKYIIQLEEQTQYVPNTQHFIKLLKNEEIICQAIRLTVQYDFTKLEQKKCINCDEFCEFIGKRNQYGDLKSWCCKCFHEMDENWYPKTHYKDFNESNYCKKCKNKVKIKNGL